MSIIPIRKTRLVKYSCLSLSLIVMIPAIQAQSNTDENKVIPYTLPDILVTEKHHTVNSQKEWVSVRRPQLLQAFNKYVYGKVPDANIQIGFTTINVIHHVVNGKATLKIINICLSNQKDSFCFPMVILLPEQAKKPVPVFLGLNFYGNHTISSDTNLPITRNYVINNPGYHIFNNMATAESRGVEHEQWQVEKILDNGYGLATIYYGDVDPDFDDGFQNGIHPLFNSPGKTMPAADEWGSISAWSYALSRAMDYFEKDKDINPRQVVVIGHSRLGKTALWAGAQDERFAMVISNNSGCGGAALSKRKFGETVKLINDRFPHWFCKNFHSFNDKEETLPVDQHMLLGLIAPRPVYVASSQEDSWADPKGEYLSLYYAAPVYRLFDQPVIENSNMPPVNTPLWAGNMAYHIRTGKHDITAFDWDQYIAFANLHFKKARVK